ncbi:MAG: C25 family cysteine peptidase [Acidobacteriota bacterium]
MTGRGGRHRRGAKQGMGVKLQHGAPPHPSRACKVNHLAAVLARGGRRLFLPAAMLLASMTGVGGTELPASVQVVEDQPGRVVLEVRLPAAERRFDLPGGGARLVLPGFGAIWQEGAPVLPKVGVRLAIPAGARLSLQTQILETEQVGGLPLAVAPQVRRVTDPENPAGAGQTILLPGHLHPDISLPFPAHVARVVERARMRRLPLTRLELTPVQLVDTAGSLKVARHFRVTLTWPAGAAVQAAGAGSDAEPFDTVYPQAVANRVGANGLRLSLRQAAGGTANVATTASLGSPALPAVRPAIPVTPLPGSLVYRLAIRQDGVYRLDVPWLSANAPDILNHRPNEIFVTAGGVEIPLRMQATGNTLDGTEYLEFFGEKVDEDPLDPDSWQEGDFTDERPYYLGAAAGGRVRAATSVTGQPKNGYPLVTHFQETVHAEVDNLFLNTVPDDQADRWYDTPFLRDTNPFRDIVLNLPGIDVTGTASLKARLLGLIIGGNLSGLHRTTVSVGTGTGGAFTGVQLDQADWDGVLVYTHGETGGPLQFPASQLSAASTVRVEVPLTRTDGNGVPITTDLIGPDWVEVTYPRLLAAAADHLTLTLPNQDTQVVVTGLTSADAAVYDITPTNGGLAAPLYLDQAVLSGTGPFALTFEFSPSEVAGTARTFAVSAGGALKPAAAAEHPLPQDLTAGAADWLVIGPEAFLDTSPLSALSTLVAQRQSQGLQTAVVNLEDVYDSFSFGLKDPQAIRDFIAWTLSNWSPAPSFVVLVGDGTLDYKNSYGHAVSRDLLPTFMESQVASPVLTYFSEDNRFAAVVGTDDIPDVMLGRIPVHDLAEAESVFTKIVAYEGMTPGAPWTRRTFFISDAESGGFEFSQRQVIDKFFDKPENPGVTDATGPCFSSGTCHNDQLGAGPIFHTASFEALEQRNPSTLPDLLAPTMNSWIRNGIDAGDAVTYFIGHGGFQDWGRDATLFQASSFGLGGGPDDVDLLANFGQPTFMVNINCITGGFHADSPASTDPDFDLSYALAEDLLLVNDRGAIGVLAPSHLTFISILGSTTNLLWDRLLGDVRDRTLGALNLAVRLKFDELGTTTDLRSFAFLADPATRLILPDPAPPGVPVAVAGNGVVDLTWSGGPDAISFELERSNSSPTNGFQMLVLPDPTATSFSDATVKNGQTYYYRVRGMDANGMRSVLSNDNADCPAGPGCVMAEPLNPDPPQTPAGFSAADTSKGGEIKVDWLSNPELDLDFYRVRYGTSSGVYPSTATFAAGATSGLLIGLQNEQPVFMVLEAVNTSGLVSPSTAEIQATPRLILGVGPPMPIKDLTLERVGQDLVLTWGQTVEDIYHRATSVQQYEIFSSSASPAFPLDATTQLAVVPDSTAPSFTHTGAGTVLESRFYLVVSRDADGVASPPGETVPAPIFDLATDRPAPGTIHLSWAPVTTDFAGNPVFVDHYEVYGSLTPFSRQMINTMVPLRSSVTGTSVDLLESEGEFFSVLAVGQRGSLSPF